jgi:hypothetical protein
MILFFLFLDSLFTTQPIPTVYLTNTHDIFGIGYQIGESLTLTNFDKIFWISDPFYPNDPPSLRPVLPVPRFLNAPSGR